MRRGYSRGLRTGEQGQWWALAAGDRSTQRATSDRLSRARSMRASRDAPESINRQLEEELGVEEFSKMLKGSPSPTELSTCGLRGSSMLLARPPRRKPATDGQDCSIASDAPRRQKDQADSASTPLPPKSIQFPLGRGIKVPLRGVGCTHRPASVRKRRRMLPVDRPQILRGQIKVTTRSQRRRLRSRQCVSSELLQRAKFPLRCLGARVFT